MPVQISQTSGTNRQSDQEQVPVRDSVIRSNLLDLGCVDRIDIMVIPVLLGAGTPLLPPPYSPTKLKLLSNRVYRSGRLSVAYEVQY